MKTFIAIHRHAYGVSVYPFKSDFNFSAVFEHGFDGTAECDEITKALHIDFEPDKDEELEIVELVLGDIPTVVHRALVITSETISQRTGKMTLHCR